MSGIDRELLDHWASAVRVTQRLVDSREEAEDCASAAVLQLLERGSDGVDNPEAFLLTIAKRRAADNARSHGRARKRDVRLAGQPPTALDVAEDVAARAEARWVAQLARDRLSPKAYQLLRLLADGHDIGDAAAALDITQRAAESLLLRARRTVRRAWSKALTALSGLGLAGRRLRIAAPAATLAATALVTAVGLQPGASTPTTTHAGTTNTRTSHVTNLLLGLTAERERPTRGAADADRARAGRPHRAPVPSASLAEVRPPTGGSVVVRREERPGHSDSPVDTIRQCVEDFRVTTDHIGC